MPFVFYDTETTGTSRRFDQILQFAAVLTDNDLNVLDRFETRCRLLAHAVPSPGAMCVTGIGLDRLLDPALPTHYEMVCAVLDRLRSWCPAVFLGWNTIGFDEEMLRQAFYQCLHPPYLTNTGGNCRTDLLPVVRGLSLLAPGAIRVPVSDEGKAVYKLDRLAPLNGFDHVAAHDALGDVEATIHVCRIVRDRAPDAWGDAVRFARKQAVVDFLEEEPAFLLLESYYGREYHFALTRLGAEPGGGNVVLAFDLKQDPAELAALDDAALARRVARSPKPVRRIRTNAAPVLAGLDRVPDFHGLSQAEWETRAARVRGDATLVARLVAACERPDYEASPHVEECIHDGFMSEADQARASRFHACGCWHERARIVRDLECERLRELGLRLVHGHAPDALPPGDRAEVSRRLALRALGHGYEGRDLTTVGTARAEAVERLGGCTPEHEAIIRPLFTWLDERERACRAHVG